MAIEKDRSNNPVGIKPNLNYDEVVRYMNGKGNKPKESNVYSRVMELAIYAKLENSTVHHDVIDALIRQPQSGESKPFKKHMIKQHALIQAVDYDLGRNGIAYFDKDTANYRGSTGKYTPGNKGYVYRNDGVDIRKDSARYEHYNVSSAESGEWLLYTIYVEKKGIYRIKLKLAAEQDGGEISIAVGGKRGKGKGI